MVKWIVTMMMLTGFALPGYTQETGAEAPAAEIPAAEVPAAEVPVPEAPAVDTPAIESPAVETPTVEVPAAEVPVLEVPVPAVPEVVVPSIPEDPDKPAELREVAVETVGPDIKVGFGGKEVTFVQPLNLEFVVKGDDGAIGIRFRDPKREILAICMNTAPGTPYEGQALLGGSHPSYSGIEEVPRDSAQEQVILRIVEDYLAKHPDEGDSKHRMISALREFAANLKK